MQEKLYFSNSKGDKLCGILSNPKSDFNVPIIILCHGFTVSKDSSTYTRFENLFNKKGVATFRFDFFGHGESEGDFENITVSEATDDIINAIKFLKSKGFSKLGLFGSSFGGMASIMAASKVSDLFVLALKSPVSDYLEVWRRRRSEEEIDEWKSKGFLVHTNSKGESKKLNYTFLDDSRNNIGYEVGRRIKVPTLIVHGDADKTVPLEQSKKMASTIQDCRLEIIKGADHKYSNSSDFDKALNLISDFVVEHIE